MHEICEGDKINDNFGGDCVASFEEVEMSSYIGSVYEDDDSVSGFDASTCSGDNFYNIIENEGKIITEDSIVWVNTY